MLKLVLTLILMSITLFLQMQDIILKQPNNYAVYNTPVADGRQTGNQQILNP